MTAYAIWPGAYLVFTRSAHFGNTQDPGMRAAFALSAGGETVYLHSGQQGVMTGYSAQARFGPSFPGHAWGRHPTNTGRVDFVTLAERQGH